MNRTNILGLGAGMRNSMLAAYNTFGNDDAARIARRYVFEIAKVMAEVHGDADAASLLYQTADNVAAKLPLEDYRLLLSSPSTGGGAGKEPAAPPPELPPEPATWRSRGARLWKALTNSFLLGFFAGFWMGSSR